MASKTGKQVITIHILLNISRAKRNHKIKFGQLIGYSVTNTFLQILCRKCGRETSFGPVFVFQKKICIE